jgi:hypothetical protein
MQGTANRYQEGTERKEDRERERESKKEVTMLGV